MPQLRLYNRRWYTATDTQPLLASFMMVSHLMLLISTAIIAGLLANARYYCDARVKLSVDIIGVLVLFVLLVTNDCLIIGFGLRGGPFEEKKRKPVIIFLYVESALIIAHFAFTIYGTYLAYSPSISDGCWNTNPCAGISGTVPAVCLPDQYNLIGPVTLSENCTWITNNYQVVDKCLSNWIGLGVGWLNQAYDPNLTPPINKNITPNCQMEASLDPRLNLQSDPNSQIEYVSRIPEASSYLVDNSMIQLMKSVGLLNQSYPWVTAQTFLVNPRPLFLSPWGECPQLSQCIRALDNDCGEWNILLNLPDGRDEKWLFRTIVFLSWFSLGVTLILDILFFNANPDYTSSESWMKSLEGVGSLFGFRQTLVNSITEEGFSASEEFGVLLAGLFGGIDMDLTDKILGIYLAGERTRWRRLRHVNAILSIHGYSQKPYKRGCLSRLCGGIGIDGAMNFEFPDRTSTVSDGIQNAKQTIVSMLPSPFLAKISDSLNSQEPSSEGPMTPPETITISHSIVRLETSETMMRSSTGSRIKNRESVVGDNKNIRVMLPVDITPLRLQPDIDSRTAAALYLDACNGYVEPSVLEEALHYSWFAKAAYGLQDRRWKAAASGKVLDDCGDYCLSKQCCMPFSKPLGLKHRFRKRNFDAIIKFTGIPPEDFLYVSYASTSFGVLPYLIMLDRKHRKVILSVRGTVGINDLMTDLLSQPVGINSFLPPSILSRAPKKPDGTPIKLFGHAGIISSAKAILQSLEDNKIFTTLCEQQSIDLSDIKRQNTMRSRKFTENLSNLSKDNEVEFPLERAASAVYEATKLNDWGIVVTGHSLGAAVASLVSMSLKETYPSLKCYAFNPPGGLVSPELSTLARDFCTSIVVGCDMISRLGILGVKNLIDDIVLSLCRCKRPKLKILWDIMLGLRKDPQTAPKTYCSIDDMDDEIKNILQQYMQYAELHAEDLDTQMLCPAGTTVFLRPYVMDDASEEWDAVYADPTDIVSEGIIVSRYSMKHHRISEMQNAISCAMSSTHHALENV